MQPLDRPLAVTFFPTHAAVEKREEHTSLRDLAPRILSTSAPIKARLPWLKLAQFGNIRKSKEGTPEDRQSLRHNANVLTISGIEADYDAEIVTVDGAADVLRHIGIAGMVYTSPSHTEDSPRWRVLCPLSHDMAPEARFDLVARLNGAFQGALANESFTLSQSYYFGKVSHNPSHRAELVDGDYIDERPDLDEGKIGKPKVEFPATTVSAGPRIENNSKFIEAVIRRAVDKVRNAPDGNKHEVLRSQAIVLGGFLGAGGYGAADAVRWLMDALPPSTRDRNAAEATAQWGVDQGMSRPLPIPERAPLTRRQEPPSYPDEPEYDYPDDGPSPGELVEVTGNVIQMPKPKAARKEKPAQVGWEANWHMSESGAPLPTLFNTMVALRGKPELSTLVRFDDMARTALLVDQIPNTKHDAHLPRPLRDADIIAIQEEIQNAGLRRIAKATVQDAIDLRASEDRFHPVHDYLNGLVWDGKPRLDWWLAYYLGCEPADDLSEADKESKRKYISKIGRLFLIAMAARVLRPGCKSDYMLILEGAQGAMKSSACRALAGGWFSDNLPDLSRGDPVRLSMHLRGKWLIEIAEMSSFNSAETHTLKEFLTQTEERYTPKYGRNEVAEPRQCLFIGSTNEGSYLRDETGGRRFWPVRVGKIDIEALRADRDQLLAEAVKLFRDGEQWWPDRDFEAEFIAPEQEARYEADAWEVDIANWLARENIHSCTVNDVAKGAINLPIGQIGTREQRRVSAALKRLGWIPRKTHGRVVFKRPGDLAL